MNHSAVFALTCSSRMIVGTATLTMVASTMIIDTPSATNGMGSHLAKPVASSSMVGARMSGLLGRVDTGGGASERWSDVAGQVRRGADRDSLILGGVRSRPDVGW